MSRITKHIKKPSGFAFNRMHEAIEDANSLSRNAYVGGRLTNVEYRSVSVSLRKRRQVEMPTCMGVYGELFSS